MPDVRIRAVRPGDREALLALRNDPDAYRWYRVPAAATEAEHDAWFEARLAAVPEDLWVATLDEDPCGSVRLDPTHGEAAVSVSVRADARGRGIGSALLAHVAEQARARGIPRLVAQVHRSNAASQRLFASAGYLTTEHGGEFDEWSIALQAS
jgi:RimJ/RimL family protein N-acetyltransferase